jgi:hypothetical protein
MTLLGAEDGYLFCEGLLNPSAWDLVSAMTWLVRIRRWYSEARPPADSREKERTGGRYR